ncbi:MAG: hypothetical protein NZT92_07805 [Abditibacteriales bacterium]|nr:hypothetical protein [Abditibacteriales bacterium]MDW8365895.1 hypothetical protein [Abditibacteriales bacterium]
MRRRRIQARRCMQLIAGSLLIPVLLGAIWLVVHHLVENEPANAAEKTESGERTARARTAHKPTLSKPQSTHYTVIAQRNLFQPLVAPKAKVTQPSAQRDRPVQPLSSSPNQGVQTSPSNVPPMFSFLPMPPSEAASNPASDRIAVVGAVRVGDDLYVLVEDVARGETRYVRAGESAFGYTVQSADADNAALARGGRTFVVALGENKPSAPMRSTADAGRTPPLSSGQPSVNPAPSNSGGLPDFASMTGEQRRQWFDQWRQSLQNLPPEQQEQMRQQMREYMRNIGGFGGLGSLGGVGGDG